MQLTPSQQKDIEDSLWVVNSALKRQGLSNNEDIRQSATLYMCECRLRFDPEKHIKWTTFAYRNVYLFIKRTIAKEKLKQAEILNKDIFDMEDYFNGTKLYILKEDNNSMFVKLLKQYCSKEERQVLKLFLQGYSQREIAEKLNTKFHRVKKSFSNIKQKAKMCKENIFDKK